MKTIYFLLVLLTFSSINVYNALGQLVFVTTNPSHDIDVSILKTQLENCHHHRHVTEIQSRLAYEIQRSNDYTELYKDLKLSFDELQAKQRVYEEIAMKYRALQCLVRQ